MKPQLHVVIGPTASGKTTRAIALARKLNTIIINADSRQFYKEMQIGTARPEMDEIRGVPHYFLGQLHVWQDYTAGLFEKDCIAFLSLAFQNFEHVVLVGGSGMYVKAITEGFDARPTNTEIKAKWEKLLQSEGLEYLQNALKERDTATYESIDLKNARRLIRALEITEIVGGPIPPSAEKKTRDFDVVYDYLEPDRKELYEKINLRVDQMMGRGLLEEVKALEKYRDLSSLQTVGYRELFTYLDGEMSLDEAVEKIKVNSRRYAKRQMTYFKNYLLS